MWLKAMDLREHPRSGFVFGLTVPTCIICRALYRVLGLELCGVSICAGMEPEPGSGTVFSQASGVHGKFPGTVPGFQMQKVVCLMRCFVN